MDGFLDPRPGGPTLARAIRDPDNDIARLARYESDPARIIEELYIAFLSRPATEAEVQALVGAFDPADIANRAALAPADAEALARAQAQREVSQTWPEWTVARPLSHVSARGATLTSRADGSIVVAGAVPDTDIYTVVLEAAPGVLRGLRLAALADEGLPNKGPGLAQSNGNFVLSELRVTAVPNGDATGARPLELRHATADFAQNGWAVGGTVDGKPGTGWAVVPRVGVDHETVFELEADVNGPTGTVLVVTLEHHYGSKHALGRLRISTTSSARPVRHHGLSPEVVAALSVSAEERSPEQAATVYAQFIRQDPRRRSQDSHGGRAGRRLGPRGELRFLVQPLNVRDHVRPLELSGDELRELVATVTEHLARYVDTLETQPVKDLEGADAIARELSRPLPEKGTPLGEILDDLFERWIPKGFNPASPGYLAFIPGGGILHAGVADLIAATINRYVGVWTAAPPLARLEADVVRWFCDMVGYPAEAGGFLTTGGSLANLSAIVTARRARLPEDFLTGVIYASEQSHHSIHKAATLAGFPRRNLRLIPADRRCRIDPQALARAVDEDRAAGRTPFLICANAGTTNTGAIDDLPGLADFAEREELWLHVDAAYGGFFRLTERGRERLRGLERADSVVLDPHKTLFLPYGTGSLIVRDVESLRRAHSQRADYMPAMQEDPDQVDFCEISPELSRDFRGLRVWLPIAMHGIGPFRDNLDEKLDLIEWATAELHALAGVEVVAEPQLTVVAFRFVQPGLDAEELDAWNARCLEEINAGGRVLLTPTQLDGRFVIRICVVSFRTHADRVEECLAAIRAVAGAV